ncbi:hypothetical protein Prubr_10690 [Polymorphospora rubra]|uniref:Uncharacterized protein n=3 Tax=Polymorphospora rubra TaxID=338584 RepID=A0A810MXH2_9ACTN|nr:hypothetical protein Prubr_10690 [Polymorphospora rubra]
MESAGGGGWGDPLERAPEDVAGDVAQEYLSADDARQRYGVELDPAGQVDPAATAATRQRLREARRWLRTTVTANPAYTGQRGQRRLAYVAPGSGLAEDTLVEVHGGHPAPLRAWIRHDAALAADELALDDDGLQILGTAAHDRSHVRVLAGGGGA